MKRTRPQTQVWAQRRNSLKYRLKGIKANLQGALQDKLMTDCERTRLRLAIWLLNAVLLDINWQTESIKSKENLLK